MFEFLKTSTGVYNLSFIITLIGWMTAGAGIFVGFHLNKVKTIEAESKAKASESQRIEIAKKLEISEARTAELESKLAPRQITSDQQSRFIQFLAASPKGPITVFYSSPQSETIEFAEHLRKMLITAGYDAGIKAEYAVGISVPTRPPTFLSIVFNPASQPSYAGAIRDGFGLIGITVDGIDGLDRVQPGQIKLFVGTR